MLILIEGLDRTGKTTLSVELQKLVGGERIHFPAPKGKTAYDEYVHPLEGYLPGSLRHVICDRHYLGELVWPRIFGRRSLIGSDAQQRGLESLLYERGALLVLARRDPTEVREAILSEPQGPRYDVFLADALFRIAYRSSTLHKMPYTHGDSMARIAHLASIIEDEATR